MARVNGARPGAIHGAENVPKSLVGIAIVAAVVLATIYVFNRFSGKNIASLGAGARAVA